jgi:hypothetical protein
MFLTSHSTHLFEDNGLLGIQNTTNSLQILSHIIPTPKQIFLALWSSCNSWRWPNLFKYIIYKDHYWKRYMKKNCLECNFGHTVSELYIYKNRIKINWTRNCHVPAMASPTWHTQRQSHLQWQTLPIVKQAWFSLGIWRKGHLALLRWSEIGDQAHGSISLFDMQMEMILQ